MSKTCWTLLFLLAWPAAASAYPVSLAVPQQEEIQRRILLLAQKVQMLEQRLEAIQKINASSGSFDVLEGKIAAQERRNADTAASATFPTLNFWKDNKLSGFVDTSYAFNFNQPHDLVSATRANDRQSNAFTLHSAWLELEHQADPLGYLFDVEFGSDAQQITDNGILPSNKNLAIVTAYLEWKPSRCLSLKFGEYSDLTGFEEVASPKNWNFSWGLLNVFVTPQTLLGARSQYSYKDWLEVYAGVFNGMDLSTDNNQAKTLEGGVKWIPARWINVFVDTIVGAQKADKSGDRRGILDLQVEYKPLEKLTIRYNFEYGKEPDAGDAIFDAVFHGHAFYARYEANAWYALSTRLESLADSQGLLTGQRQHLWEVTVTNEFKVFTNLITRVELRHDQSGVDIFEKSNVFEDYQNTLALEAIYLF